MSSLSEQDEIVASANAKLARFRKRHLHCSGMGAYTPKVGGRKGQVTAYLCVWMMIEASDTTTVAIHAFK